MKSSFRNCADIDKVIIVPLKMLREVCESKNGGNYVGLNAVEIERILKL